MVYESIAAMQSVQSWIIAYIGISFASAFGFVLLRSTWHLVPNVLYVIHAAIVVWSATMYMNFLYETPVSSIAWYLDWIVSTPLIVLALALTAQFQQPHMAWGPTWLLIGAQALTIVTGLLAHVTSSVTGMYMWFTLGCGMMLIVWYVIWFPMMRIAREHSAILHRKYMQLGALVILLWLTYPTVWIVSPLGLGYISYATTSILFVILPVLCKSGFGFLDLYSLHQVAYTHGQAKRSKAKTASAKS